MGLANADGSLCQHTRKWEMRSIELRRWQRQALTIPHERPTRQTRPAPQTLADRKSPCWTSGDVTILTRVTAGPAAVQMVEVTRQRVPRAHDRFARPEEENIPAPTCTFLEQASSGTQLSSAAFAARRRRPWELFRNNFVISLSHGHRCLQISLW